MAAKKKAPKKKAAKKKPAAKKAPKKKVATKIALDVKKKTTKKKPTPKPAIKPKAPAKKKPPEVKKPIVKKAAPEPKKSSGTRGIGSSTIEAAISRGGDTAIECGELTMDITFEMNGKLIATLEKPDGTSESKTADETCKLTFDSVCRGDAISIDGGCAGKTEYTTNRKTKPASGTNSPRKFPPGTIIDSLDIL